MLIIFLYVVVLLSIITIMSMYNRSNSKNYINRTHLVNESLQNIIPEAIAALLIIFGDIETGNFASRCLLFLIDSILIRLIWNSAIIIHGLGHTVSIAIVDRQLSTFTPTNILEHRSIKTVLKSLLPLNNIFIPILSSCLVSSSSCQPYLAAGHSSCWRIRIKSVGGIFFNLFSIALVTFLYPDRLTTQIFTVANLLIAISSLSDIDALVTGVADYFYCGNFGFVAQRQPDDGNEL